MTSCIRRAAIAAALVVALSAGGGTTAQSGAPVATVPAQVMLGVPGLVNSGPSLAALGRLVVAVWTAGKAGVADVYAAVSEDGGTTFSAPRRVNDQDGDVSPNGEQPPRVAISASGSARLITVFWSKRGEATQKARQDVVRMARSTDGGRTFAPAKTIHDSALSGARGWESLAAGPDGSVHAVWLDGRDAERRMAEAKAHTHEGAPMRKGQPPQDVYHGRLTPEGRIEESLIATDVCFCCKTAVAVDGRGGVYAAWRHIFPGSLRDMAFARSTDGGRRWGPLVRVSEDGWELNGCPEDGPAMAIDASGTVHMAWATLVTEGESQKALFYATSRDGKVFSPRARVPTAGVTNPSHPQMTLTSEGAAVIVWDEVVEGVRRVSMSRFPKGGAFAPPQVVSGSEPALYPVIARLGAGDLVVAWTSRSSADRSMVGVRRLGAPRQK